MAKNINHHLYQDKNSEVWYFQKKVRGRSQPYKISLGTKSKIEARRKRDAYLKEIDQQGHITSFDPVVGPESTLFGDVAVQWSKIVITDLSHSMKFTAS